MATFIATFKFTQQGVKDFDQSVKRAAAFAAEAGKIGAKVKEIYWLMGDHDGLLILEAPDDETVTAAMLHLASKGNVQTSTCRAFTAEEMEKLVKKAHQA